MSLNSIAHGLLDEFESETHTTRRFLERVPNDKLGWRPHEKSMSAGQLALHIAQVPAGVVQMAVQDRATLPDFREQEEPTSVSMILSTVEHGVATVRQHLLTINDERMRATLEIVKGDRVLLALPRQAFLRNILLNHWYHHRGQFGVYLRLLGAAVPSSYGPSGDEMPAFAM